MLSLWGRVFAWKPEYITVICNNLVVSTCCFKRAVWTECKVNDLHEKREESIVHKLLYTQFCKTSTAVNATRFICWPVYYSHSWWNTCFMFCLSGGFRSVSLVRDNICWRIVFVLFVQIFDDTLVMNHHTLCILAILFG